MCEWVLKSGNTVEVEVIVKSYKNYGISNVFDDTDKILLEVEDGDTLDSIDDFDALSRLRTMDDAVSFQNLETKKIFLKLMRLIFILSIVI